MSSRTQMETRSGTFIDFAAPSPDDINIDDIAHALGHTCRFGGHCAVFYSVAEHALVVRRLVIEAGYPELAVAALHHDSHEAYIGDIPTPLKNALGSRYREMVDALDLAIGEALDIDPEQFHARPIVEADQLALRIEAARLKRSKGISGAWPWRDTPPSMPEWFKPGMRPLTASELFLAADAKDRELPIPA